MAAQLLQMKLTVNGNPCVHAGEGTLASLLAEMGADGERVAVMLNDVVLRGPDRGKHELHEGDKLEVLKFAGGG